MPALPLFVECKGSRALESGLLNVQHDPDMDGVRNDPRYLDLLKRFGLD